MKLASPQLEQHLAKKLASIYLISSDELLLVQEACDMIRTTARKAGFSERISLTTEGNDWGKTLYAEVQSLSLFTTQRIIELHLTSTKPNATANKILQEISQLPLTNTLLIIHSSKLDSKTEQSNWYKTIDKTGIILQIRPITPEQFPSWISQRAKKIGLVITQEGAQLLADQVEGNLLAAAQELEKLSLLQITQIDNNIITQTAVDSARFDIFNLVDCVLGSNSKRALRILDNLKAEDTEPVLILWALTRELRMLINMTKELKQGAQLGMLFSQFRVWEKRKANVRNFLQKHSQQSCWQLLKLSARIDRIIKGAEKGGDIWEELKLLILKIAGRDILNIPLAPSLS